MSVKMELKDQVITAYLEGEIDHHTAASIRNDIDIRVESSHPNMLILDFTNVSFMDSSGIGLVMGRYKLMKAIDGTLKIVNPSLHIRKVLSLAGIDRLAIVEKNKPYQRRVYFDKK